MASVQLPVTDCVQNIKILQTSFISGHAELKSAHASTLNPPPPPLLTVVVAMIVIFVAVIVIIVAVTVIVIVYSFLIYIKPSGHIYKYNFNSLSISNFSTSAVHAKILKSK